MSLWPGSDDIGNKEAKLPEPDTIPEQSRTTNGVVGMTNNTGGNPQPFISTMNGKLILSDGTVNLAFIGLKDVSGVMRPVVRIAKPGFEAETTADENLIFNSDQNVLKVITSGSGALAAPASSTSYVDIPYPAGVVAGTRPIVLAFGRPSDASQYWGVDYWQPFPVTYYGLTSGKIVIDTYMHLQISTTGARIAITRATSTDPAAGGTWYYKYYILQETAS